MTKSLKVASDLLELLASNAQRYPFLLESTACSQQINSQQASGGLPLNQTACDNARYSILFAFPKQRIELTTDGVFSTKKGKTKACKRSFLNVLEKRRKLAASKNRITDSSLPFSGGWFVYLSYEFAQQVEPSLDLPVADKQMIAAAVRIPAALIVDHVTGELHIVDDSKNQRYRAKILADIESLKSLDNTAKVPVASAHVEAGERYIRQVERAKEYIVDGDIFQSNLSRSWRVKSSARSSIELYQALRLANPAAFAGIALFEQQHIVSSSPERLVSVKSNRVNARPIAGTHPRGKTLVEDKSISEKLLNHPKEQAEHIMLIDLVRNDLGRICEPGTVEVDELMALESYAYVHHIVSSVSGQLQNGKTPSDVIAATFPGGTITGCPKVRCMEIIAELEQQPRGAYTGSMGYINHNGDMDLNILIRTLERDTAKNEITLRAGAGIVFDSVAEKELAETAAKAKGLLKIFN